MRFFVFLLLLNLAWGPLPALTITSDSASYKDRQMDLSGHVHFAHELGDLTADEAQVTRDEGTLDFSNIKELRLSQNVHIQLKEGVSLQCEAATLLPSSSPDKLTQIIATGPLTLTYRGSLQMKAEGKALLFISELNREKKLHSIESQDRCWVSHSSENSKKTLLYCPAGFFLDHFSQHLNASLKASNPPEKIRLDDALGTLEADHLSIHYTQNQESLVLKQIIFSEHIKLTQHATASSNRYATADLAIYVPEHNKITLSSSAGRHVNVFDPSQKTRMRASSIHFTYDPKTHREAIQCDGPVRLIIEDLSKE